jgi:hypothetical protein
MPDLELCSDNQFESVLMATWHALASRRVTTHDLLQCRTWFCAGCAAGQALFSFYLGLIRSSVPHACTIPKGALGFSPLILIFASDVAFSNLRSRSGGFLKFSIDSQRLSSLKFYIWSPTTQRRCFVQATRPPAVFTVCFPLILFQAPIHLHRSSGMFPCRDDTSCCPPCTTPYVPLFDEIIDFIDRYSVECTSVTVRRVVVKDV